MDNGESFHWDLDDGPEMERHVREERLWELTASPISLCFTRYRRNIIHFYIISSTHIHVLSNSIVRAQFPLAWMLWEEQHVWLTWPTMSVGFTTMVCASISLMWKSSPETVISCFTKERVHCMGSVYSHTDSKFAPPSCKDPLDHLSILTGFLLCC